ncbi:YgaP family membrane protein [Neisseria canis]|uniref:Protein of uncharacterized function (DUF2892) n=1 Tax=Neisseria canis TaxID=493 RepID=A0A448D869_9NEIS|nr:DUF2892 domain-containing protein [Neisseria canis]OSI12161.1 hypothetical protein BWD07_06795 [Neisseria canis]VEF01208.1 Protein of uncharacterised function (DUF2892) [Neisseria canis]
MKRNVGGIDKIIRIILGTALIILAATNVIGWWGWLGIIPLATGLMSNCLLYTLLGINTCPTDKQ